MDLGELKVRISADVAALAQGLEKAQGQVQDAGKKMQAAGAGMRSVGVGMSALVTLPILALGKMGVEELAAVQKATAQTNAVIKSTGGAAGVSAKQIQSLAGDLQKLSGVDDTVIQSGQNMLLTFTNVQNRVGKGNDVFNQASKTMLDMSVAMGTDAKSTAIQLGKALNDPVKGVSALSEVGVTFTAQQKKQIEAMAKAGNVAGAQKVVLAELNKEFGGSAAAAGKTLPAKMALLKDSLAGVSAKLVEQLIPAVMKVGEWLTKFVDWFEKLSPAQQKWGAIIAVCAAALGPLLIVVGSVVSAIGVLIPVVTAVTLPMLAIVAAIALVVVAGVLMYKHWDTVKAKLAAAWNAIKSGVTKAFTEIKAFVANHAVLIATVIMGPIGGLTVWLIKNWSTVRDKTSEVWSAIKTRAASAWDGLRDNIVNIAQAIPGAVVGALSSLAGKLAGLGSAAGHAFANAIKSAINAVIGKFNSLSIPSVGVGKLKTPAVDLPNLPTFARGGITSGPSIAGEAGPEAVIPLGGSRQNAMDRQRMMGELGMGRGINQTFIVTNPVEDLAGFMQRARFQARVAGG